jgi:branched-chain amino acid transport system permease protein
MPLLISQAFNGLALGSLLALVASGLTIILGTLGVLNFAHGALFIVGAYAVFVVLQSTNSFVLALVVGSVFMLVVGVLIERVVIRLFYHRPPEDQILVTFGVGIVLVEALRAIFGGNSQHVPVPSWGEGVTQLGFLIYPTYRLQLIGIIAMTLAVLWLVLYRTSIGLVVRAGIETADMVGILGINVRRAFLLVFAIGVTAAGFAGMIYAPILSVTPDSGEPFLVQAFVVIVIGGLGSLVFSEYLYK